jgi:hypothetical protein
MSRLPNAETEVVDNLGQPAVPVIDSRTIPRAVCSSSNKIREARVRDKRKRQLCKENGVKLIYFTPTEDLSVERVEKKLKPFLPVIGLSA